MAFGLYDLPDALRRCGIDHRDSPSSSPKHDEDFLAGGIVADVVWVHAKNNRLLQRVSRRRTHSLFHFAFATYTVEGPEHTAALRLAEALDGADHSARKSSITSDRCYSERGHEQAFALDVSGEVIQPPATP